MWYFLVPNLHLFLLHLFICISFDMSVIGVDDHFLLQLGALEQGFSGETNSSLDAKAKENQKVDGSSFLHVNTKALFKLNVSCS